MHTIRGRLVVSYAVALVATMTVFASTIYLVQRSENFAELDARARLEADLIAELLAGAARSSPDPIVVRDPDNGKPHLNSALESLLQVLQDYVIVLGPDGTPLYTSEDARALPYAAFVRLAELVGDTTGGRTRFGLTDLGQPVGEVRYVVHHIPGAGPAEAWVASGEPTAGPVVAPPRPPAPPVLCAPSSRRPCPAAPPPGTGRAPRNPAGRGWRSPAAGFGRALPRSPSDSDPRQADAPHRRRAAAGPPARSW